MHKTIKTAAVAAFAIFACGAGLSVSASAQDNKSFVGVTETSRRACFDANRVDGYAPIKFSEGVDGVNLRSGKDVFQLKFAAPCPGIRDSLRISVETRNVSRYVCSPTDANVVSYSRLTGPEQCVISGVRKLEPSELASLPSAEKP